MVACHPIALAASAAALLGIDALIDAWPTEMTTIFLPLAAGRAVPSGCRRVPLKCLATAASTWALPDPCAPLVAGPETLVEPVVELQAVSTMTMSAPAHAARRLRTRRLNIEPLLLVIIERSRGQATAPLDSHGVKSVQPGGVSASSPQSPYIHGAYSAGIAIL